MKVRSVTTTAFLIMLTGCAAARPELAAGTAAAVTPAATSSLEPVRRVTPAASSATPLPPSLAAVGPTEDQSAGQVSGPATYRILPLFPLGAAGAITVDGASGGVHYRVTIQGLVPGSRHTVHDHMGACTSANRSVHLLTLATAAADGHGVIRFDATVPIHDFGAGRIVIVYDSARPVAITGCATL